MTAHRTTAQHSISHTRLLLMFPAVLLPALHVLPQGVSWTSRSLLAAGRPAPWPLPAS